METIYKYIRKRSVAPQSLILIIMFLVQTFVATNIVKAEGTVDFINYPGYRLMLFAERQQQTKVYTKTGEFINFGASHIGITDGFIKVYRPDGTLHSIYDNTGASSGLAIINNHIEEQNGPTGGGTTMGTGYVPGIIEVLPGEEGAWSITFEYPTYTNAAFDNLLNADPWDRDINQPLNQRVVLAWDITVSQNAAGNNGGNLLEGRVFTNEYQSIVNFNGNLTSPTFYVLTPDGFQYQVDFHDVDPWGFPIFSNNWGMVTGAVKPTYSSFEDANVTRSEDISSWDPTQIYLYEPQAEDTDDIINNKVFFNLPNQDMPNETLTTDIYRGNTHITWLLNPPAPIEVVINGVAFVANDSTDEVIYNAYDPIQGAWFTITSSLSGTARVDLDLNANGIFGEEEDAVLFKRVEGGVRDSLFWDGKSKEGIATYAPSINIDLPFRINVFGGEIHLLMGDIENDLGGLSFTRINGGGSPVDTFYYDHRNIGSTASGGVASGEPLPTTIPYTYSGNFGNRKTLDYWTYVAFAAEEATFLIQVVPSLDVLSPDSDGDTVRDDFDIDDDNDGIPDMMEYCNVPGFACVPNGIDPSGDLDFDGICNILDADDPDYPNSCADLDGDGICDSLLAVYDADGDGIPNHLDLDSDNDGITDLVEANHDQLDADGNGVIDGVNSDFTMNGLYNPIASDSDSFDAVITYTVADSDNDGVLDFLDLDSDNDGIYDLVEAGHDLLTDADTNGMGDGVFPLSEETKGLLAGIDPTITGNGIPLPLNSDDDTAEDYKDKDSDDDGVTDVLEGGNLDIDNDGVLGTGILVVDNFGLVSIDGNGTVITYTNPLDSDNDGVYNYVDLDSDNDGINDVLEGGNLDADNDGIIGTGILVTDANGLVITDANGDTYSVTSNPLDSDNDGVYNYVDLDSDNDGINDVLEGGNLDADNDGLVGTGTPVVNTAGQVIIAGLVASTSTILDSDNDGVYNYVDLDSDNDGINDVLEGGNLDSDDDGLVGTGIPAVNTDGQVVIAGLVASTSNIPNSDNDELYNYVDLDSDNDGINDVIEGGNLDADNDGIVGTDIPIVNDLGQVIIAGLITSSSTVLDSDNDGIYNYVDLDSDNDGINDVVENGLSDLDNDGIVGLGIPMTNDHGQVLDAGVLVSTSILVDTDGDNIMNYVDLDSDNDGINDVLEGGNLDSDDDGLVGTGIPTVNDLGQPTVGGIVVSTSTPTDTDGDDLTDFLDIDSDNDGINDVEEAGLEDSDNDGIVGTGTPTVNDLGQPTVNGVVISTSNPSDTDGDEVADYQDLDSDNDGINDVEEAGLEDSDNDGIVGTGTPTVNDLGQPTVNGVVISTSNPLDTDGDEVADYLDLDSDNDGINDVEEAGNEDPDNDGVAGTGTPTVNDLGQPTVNGVVISTSNPSDTDGDEVADYQDLDSDNDGINDVEEAGNDDPDNDGIVGTGTPDVNDMGQPTVGGVVVSTSSPTDTDTDGDGVPDYQDLDSDNDGINDVEEAGLDDPDNDGIVGTGTPDVNDMGQPTVGGVVVSTSTPTDTDGNGDPDYQDLDSDDDGIVDVIEGGGMDPDNDGIVGTGTPVVNDNGQPTDGGVVVSTSNPTDTDGNGDPDFQDLDSDDDGITDMYECPTGNPCVDTDGNGDPDYQDLDSDDDGITDMYECPDGEPCPDTDGDGDEDYVDLDSDDDGLSDEEECPDGEPCPDTDGDGDEDQLDVDCLVERGLIQSNGNVCQGENILLTLLNSTDYFDLYPGSTIEFVWYGNGTTYNTGDTPELELATNLMSSTQEIFTLRIKVDGCLSDNSDPVEITIEPAPVASILTANIVVCVGEQVALSAATVADATYTWFEAGTTNIVATTQTFTIDQAMATTAYEVVVSTPNCSIESIDQAVVTVNPDASIAMFNTEVTYCEGEAVVLTATTNSVLTGDVTYTWTGPAGTFTETVTASESFDWALGTATSAVTGMYELSLETASGCTSNTASLSVALTEELVVPELQLSATKLCEGDMLVLSVPDATYTDVTYIWKYQGMTLETSTNPSYGFSSVTEFQIGAYTVEVVSANCGSAESTALIVEEVIPTSVVPTVKQVEPVCEGEVVILEAENYTISQPEVLYTWYGPNDEELPAQNNLEKYQYILYDVQETDEGQYYTKISFDPDLGCDPLVSDRIMLEVKAQLDTPVLIASQTSVCEMGTITLDLMNTTELGAMALYEWHHVDLNGNDDVLEITSNPSIALTDLMVMNSGTYYVLIDANECLIDNDISIEIEVSSMPTEMAFAGTDTAPCGGTTTQLNATMPSVGTGMWTSLSGATIEDASSATTMVTDLVVGENVFVWTLSNGACEAYAMDEVVVTLDAATETANAGADIAAPCDESSVELNATMPSVGTGMWTSLSGATIEDASSATTMVTGLVAGENVFVWTLSNGACEAYAMDEVVVTLDAATETANAGADIAAPCDESSVELNATMPSVGTGMWTSLSGATIEDASSATTMVTGLVAGENIFVWTLSNGGCVDYAMDEIVVTLDAATETANAGADIAAPCDELTTQLNATMPSVGTGVWTSLTTGTTIVDATSATTMVTDLQEGNNVFVWTLSNGGCINYATDTVVVSLDTPTETAYAGENEAPCGGEPTTQLNAIQPSVGTGLWTSLTPGTTIADASSATTMATDLEAGDNVFVWTLSTDNCENYSADTLIVSFTPLVDEALVFMEDISICITNPDGNLTLVADEPDVATGTWTQTIGPSVATIAGNGTNAITTVDALEEGLYEFTWSLTQGDCVNYSQQSVQVSVSEAPAEDALVIDNEMIICETDEVLIEALDPQIGEGQWIALSNVVSVLDSDNPITFVSGLSLGINQLMWTLSYDECEDYSMDTLTIIVQEGVSTQDDAYTLEYGQNLTANVLENDSYSVSNSNWSIMISEDVQNGQLTLDALTGEITYVPNEGFAGQDEFQYTLCNQNCGDCQEALVTIDVAAEVFTECFVPNIITPNNDGFNDYLVIPCVSTFENNHILIFNRWGDKVYDKEFYQNDWQGQFNHGILPAGTYFYIFKQDKDGEDAMQGYITIHR